MQATIQYRVQAKTLPSIFVAFRDLSIMHWNEIRGELK